MMRTAINWVASVLAVSAFVWMGVAVSVSSAHTTHESIAIGLMFLFWSVGVVLGLFGPLLKRRSGHLAFGCFMLGFAVMLGDQAIGVFHADPSARFRDDGTAWDWYSRLISVVYRQLGAWGTAILFVLSSIFFASLAFLAFKDPVSGGSADADGR